MQRTCLPDISSLLKRGEQHDAHEFYMALVSGFWKNARKLKSKYNVPIEIYQMGCKTLLSSSFMISCVERIQRRVCEKTEQKGMI